MASIRKRGNRWQVQVRRINQPTVTKSFVSHTDAQRWAREQERLADRGALSRPKNTGLTMGDLLRDYLAKVTPRKRGICEPFVIGQLLRGELEPLRLSGISPAPFAKYRDDRLASVKPSTVVRELTILQHAIDIAADEWGWPIKSNPLKTVRRPRVDRGRERRLEKGEETTLLAACKKARTPWLLPAVQLAIETAMRRGEILNARWANLSEGRNLLTIPETKTGIPRQIPLSAEARRIIEGLREKAKGERIIPTTPLALRLSWVRALRRAQIEGLHFHDLRHEAISRLFEHGLNTAEVALISGHRDFRMLARYTHLKAEDVAKKLR